MVTFASGTLHNLPIRIVSSSSTTASVANFQQMIQLSLNNFSPFLGTTYQNMNWQDGSGNIISSWLESVSTAPTLLTTWWLNLGALIIPANSFLTVYLCFYATATNCLDGTVTGCSPTFTSTYAQYDNGATIFVAYDNFAGSSLNAQWTRSGGAPTVNNGVTLGTNSTLTFNTTTYTGNYAVDVLASNVNNISGRLLFGVGNAVETILPRGDPTINGTYFAQARDTLGATLTAAIISLIIPFTTPQVWTMQVGSTFASGLENYGNASIVSPNANGFNVTSMAPIITQVQPTHSLVQWWRLRLAPIGGNMPQAVSTTQQILSGSYPPQGGVARFLPQN